MTSRTLTQATKDLIAAKERIEDRENWWPGPPEKANGRDCAMTALNECDFHYPAWPYLRQAALELFDIYEPAAVNDTLGHEAVMRMYDRAIQLSMEG